MLINQWFHQLDLLGQGDGEGWMNILFIIVVAVIMGVGQLIKAAANARNKRDQQQGGGGAQARKPHGWIQQLVEKAEEIQRAVEGQQQQQQRRKPQQSRPAQKQTPAAPPKGQVAVRTGRDGQSVLVFEPSKRPQPSAKPPTQAPPRPRQPQPARQPSAPTPRHQRPQPAVARPLSVSSKISRPTPIPETVETPTPRPAPPLVNPPKPTVSVASDVIDRTDPEALRRAILHAEILGKPLALRDPFQRGAF